MRIFQRKHPAFLESEIGRMDAEESLFHVLPVPLERTVSYGAGTAAGPSAILKASQALELYDGYGIPALYGIHTKHEVRCRGPIKNILHDIKSAVTDSVSIQSMPVLLGGEHTLTSGAVAALKETEKTFGVVQFDAHADLRDSYEDDIYSHACVMKRIHDMGIPIFQIGIRSMSPEEVTFRETFGIGHLDDIELARNNIPEHILPVDFPKSIYITFDIDAFSPSLIPATGTPEPGGLDWHKALFILENIISERQILGFDVVELAPIKGIPAPDFTAARLVYNIMGMVTRKSLLLPDQNQFYRTT